MQYVTHHQYAGFKFFLLKYRRKAADGSKDLIMFIVDIIKITQRLSNAVFSFTSTEISLVLYCKD